MLIRDFRERGQKEGREGRLRGDEGFERGALEKKYLPPRPLVSFDLFVNSAFFEYGKKSKKSDNKGIEGGENVLKNKGICTCYY